MIINIFFINLRRFIGFCKLIAIVVLDIDEIAMKCCSGSISFFCYLFLKHLSQYEVNSYMSWGGICLIFFIACIVYTVWG